MININATDLNQICFLFFFETRNQQTSDRSKTRKLPPPDVSVTIAKNFELTAQKHPSCALRVIEIFL